MTNKFHILLVDDDPLNLKLFGSQLSAEGFEIVYAHNGQEALKIAQTAKPDVILLDYIMPEMDGLETAMKLREGDETKHIPILMLTNIDLSIEAQKDFQELGVHNYLHKGEDFKVILDAINKVLQP